MYEDEYERVNGVKPSASAYYNEYKNTNPVRYGEEDYKNYLTKSLLGRGFLFYNSKRIEDLYKERVDSLYKEEFRKLFLYDTDRIIKGVYTDDDSVVKMNVIGYYDFLSSLLTPNTAKFFKLIEPFTSEDYNVLDLIEDGEDEDSKKLILAEILDKAVMDELRQCITNIRIIMTCPLYEPIKATSLADMNNVHFRNMHIVYNNIDRVFTLLALYFSVKDLIGDISPIYKSYIKTIENLKDIEKLPDMFSVREYFSEKVIKKFITKEMIEKYDYVVIHPMFDMYAGDPTSRSVPEVIVAYCENAMNLRYMIREIVTPETDFDTLFSLLLGYTNLYVQAFYIRSYVSMKEPGGQRHVKDMFRFMNPIHEATVKKELTYSYLKEVIKNGLAND